MLWTELGKRVPTRIEQHEDRPDVMPRGYVEKGVEALFEAS